MLDPAETVVTADRDAVVFQCACGCRHSVRHEGDDWHIQALGTAAEQLVIAEWRCPECGYRQSGDPRREVRCHACLSMCVRHVWNGSKFVPEGESGKEDAPKMHDACPTCGLPHPKDEPCAPEQTVYICDKHGVLERHHGVVNHVIHRQRGCKGKVHQYALVDDEAPESTFRGPTAASPDPPDVLMMPWGNQWLTFRLAKD